MNNNQNQSQNQEQYQHRGTSDKYRKFVPDDNNPYRPGFKVNKVKNDIRESKETGKYIFNIVLFCIAIIHVIFFYSKFKIDIRTFLEGKGTFSSQLIDFVIVAYTIVTAIFIIVSGWKLVKYKKWLEYLYAFIVIGIVGYYGYICFTNKAMFDPFLNYQMFIPSNNNVVAPDEDISPSRQEEMALEEAYNSAINIYQNALSQWTEDTQLDPRLITYARSNGEDCENVMSSLLDGSRNFTITVNDDGNVTEFKMEYGYYQFTYEGDGLQVYDITKDSFIRITDENRLIIDEC